MKETTQKAKVIQQRGKFMLQTADGLHELPENLVMGETQLKEMVGKEVELILAEPIRGVVALKLPDIHIPHCYFILCYYPPPPWDRLAGYMTPIVEKEVRLQVAKTLREKGVISPEMHEKLIA